MISLCYMVRNDLLCWFLCMWLHISFNLIAFFFSGPVGYFVHAVKQHCMPNVTYTFMWFTINTVPTNTFHNIFLSFLLRLGHLVLIEMLVLIPVSSPEWLAMSILQHMHTLIHTCATSLGCPPSWLPNGPWALIWMATVLRRMSRANRESSSSGLRATVSVTPAVKETFTHRS